MLLSAAIIVRDEADHLDSCLTSLHPLVDEIVVVDTGSTDDSIGVATRHGARVVREGWHDDFALARNRSLDLASGAWILYIDADERLHSDDHAAARAALAADDDRLAGLVPFVPQVGWTPYREYRLWRNRPDIRFRGAMHESIVESVTAVAARARLRVAPFDLVTIEHLGYEGDQSAKLERDEPMLRAELDRLPERTYLYDHLARVHEARGDSGRAIATWQQGIEVARRRGCGRPDDFLVYIDLIFHLLERGAVDRFLVDLVAEALAAFGRVPTLELAAARVELATGQVRAATDRVEWLVSIDPDEMIDTGRSFDRRVFGEWAWDLLGRCRFAAGDDAGAVAAFARAEAIAPDVAEYAVRRRLAEARRTGAGGERA